MPLPDTTQEDCLSLAEQADTAIARKKPQTRVLKRLLAEGPEVSQATRNVMRANRAKDTSPELAVRRALHAVGLRFRLHARGLPGRPDVVLASRHAVVEVRGCFWHGHECMGGRVPRTRPDFWAAKVAANKERDAYNEAALHALGWKVFVVWECEVRRGCAPGFAERLTSLPRLGRFRGVRPLEPRRGRGRATPSPD